MKLKKADQQQLWVEAQRRCRLSNEAVQLAKEMGLNPRSLIKNIPSPSERWKAPVEDWVRAMAAKREEARARKGPKGPKGPAIAEPPTDQQP